MAIDGPLLARQQQSPPGPQLGNHRRGASGQGEHVFVSRVSRLRFWSCGASRSETAAIDGGLDPAHIGANGFTSLSTGLAAAVFAAPHGVEVRTAVVALTGPRIAVIRWSTRLPRCFARATTRTASACGTCAAAGSRSSSATCASRPPARGPAGSRAAPGAAVVVRTARGARTQEHRCRTHPKQRFHECRSNTAPGRTTLGGPHLASYAPMLGGVA